MKDHVRTAFHELLQIANTPPQAKLMHPTSQKNNTPSIFI
jgi:hypothetical protein